MQYIKLTFELQNTENNENVSLGFSEVALVNVRVTIQTVTK